MAAQKGIEQTVVSRGPTGCRRQTAVVSLSLQLTNPKTGLAVQIQTEDYHMIGWAPRYLVEDLVKAMAESPGDYRAEVVRVNPLPAPSKQRVLIEMKARWKKHKPMSGDDFHPLAE